MAELLHLDRTESKEHIIAALEQDGGVILDNFVSARLADQLLGDFRPFLDQSDWGREGSDAVDAFFGLRTKRLHGLVEKSSRVEDIMLDPLLNQLANHVLQEPKTLILSTAELMAIGESEAQQMLHRDGDSWMHMPQPPGELLFSINLALTDFTEDNGATVLAPGSHKWDRAQIAKEQNLAKATMQKGSALLYTGQLIHGGGSNITDALRVGLYLGFIPGWLRPIENIHVTHSEEALLKLSQAGRERIGYCGSGFTVVV